MLYTNISVLSPTLVSEQQEFFQSEATLNVAFRIKYLKKLRLVIQEHEAAIHEALFQDLHKSAKEAYITETSIVYKELDEAIRHTSRWAKPRKVRTPLFFLPATSKIHPEPYGNVLVIAPWNYPFQLLFAPIIGALSAGNTVVCKPSELAPHTTAISKTILEQVFPPEYVSVVEGGIPESTALLKERWDYIFFTGSTAVGRIVYQAAAKHLTPVTLELGGKSPCIIDKKVHLDYAANRIVWGKLMNAGQTCVAPDYFWVHEEVKTVFIEKIKEKITQFYSENPQTSSDYCRIINEKHFDRIEQLMNTDKVIFGGKTERADRYIAPTIMDNISWEDAVMKEEIFGPLFPILTWNDKEEMISTIKKQEKPLALYVFSQNKSFCQEVIKKCPSGGATINDTIIHLANPNLPFGGVGESGMGAYHGKSSFDVFSHKKSVLHKSNFADVSLRYPPYKIGLDKLKRLMQSLM